MEFSKNDLDEEDIEDGFQDVYEMDEFSDFNSGKF